MIGLHGASIVEFSPNLPSKDMNARELHQETTALIKDGAPLTLDRRPALRVLGWCAIVAALTTLINTVLPRFYSATGFDARTALIHNPFYAARQWVLLVHPAFTLMGALGLALAIWNRAPGRAAAGYSFAFIEKVTEFFLGVTILFVVNADWKASYLSATGTPAAATLRAQIEGFNDILGGAYFLLWVMFIISTTLFISAIEQRDRVARVLVFSGVATIGLTMCMMLGQYAGQQAWVNPLIAWTYPPALTAHRLCTGLWLIRESRR